VLAVPSPATETHSTPEPEPPSSVKLVAIGAGTTTFISFDEPAVLITLPPTCTSAWADEADADPEDDPEPLEQPPSQHSDTAIAATAALRRTLDGRSGLGLIHQTNHERVPNCHVR
jgi:hypothetical protein